MQGVDLERFGVFSCGLNVSSKTASREVRQNEPGLHGQWVPWLGLGLSV